MTRQLRQYEVHRPAPTTDPGGGQDAPVVFVGTVRVDIAEMRAAERVLAHQSGVEHTHRGFKRPGELEIMRGDELRGDGQRFLVISSDYRFEARRWVFRLLRREPQHV